MYEYNEHFYAYINEGSLRSAQNVLARLVDIVPVPIETVLDVGCGTGAWLSVWRDFGAQVTGLDGDYIPRDQLLIDDASFLPTDLGREFTLDRKFTLAQCLEVAEHLAPEVASRFVEILCGHSDLVLFSAAPPGQGGENHVNEQPYEYWRELFHRQGFRMYDALRPALVDEKEVMPWYRYNTFLYISDKCPEELHLSLAEFALPLEQPISDISPTLYQWRKRLIRMLPKSASTALARLKKTLHITMARSRRIGV